ncbi:interferon-induced GTP-binding protein Mx2-like isoform X1 [Engystomops pustulosus]|uniref:interferon-induced GTP-binding protein Mx2-like isoform X1 n=1 Tax=Engystomops pustulosus TaxID=76066 RepID=UPI003AFA68BE
MQTNGQASNFPFGTSKPSNQPPLFSFNSPSSAFPAPNVIQPSSFTTPTIQSSPLTSKSIIQPATFAMQSPAPNLRFPAPVYTTTTETPPAMGTTTQEPITNGGSSELFGFQVPTTQPDNILGQQYEYKIRPCIDLIDSLRSLGVEKDLALPAIAVVGDQSSGKSSVLEALSGVNLPRGSGIVTRCPLVLKLKKSKKDSPWKGKISYRNQEVVLKNPGEVEKEIRKAQDHMAGVGNGVSQKLISLEIESPNVPDLTLLDLPGITRVALPNQPKDIGQQIKNMIKKYIQRQETINLAVVPSNVDIATTEALEMAREVDPNGERTLGILTKPDLVDKGSELEVVSVVRNLVYTLKKGYMIVKCRGQSEIHNNISLEAALQNEKDFFENHEHFGVLLDEGRATISLLAEKLTNELVEHISRTIPTLENQIKTKLQEAEKRVKSIGLGVPEGESERRLFLVDRIRHFIDGITEITQGEEEVLERNLKLFTSIRKKFYQWETTMKQSAEKFPKELRSDVAVYENKHRGRELVGFVNYKTFENIAKNQIQTFEEPSITKLYEITELVRASLNNAAWRFFYNYPNLYRSAKGKLEEICSEQQKDAEKAIRTQFKMEQIIYCQDALYGGSLKDIRDEAPNINCKSMYMPTQMQMSVEEMTLHIQAYFKNTTARLSNQIPLIILHYMLHEFADQLKAQMLLLPQDRESLNVLLVEKNDLARERQNLKDQIKRLCAAQQRLAKYPC